MKLVPAYGRDYKSQEEVKADWDSNKDFIIADISSHWNGRDVNKEDAAAGSHTIRYKNLTQVCVVRK